MDLFTKKLASSGLTLEDGEKLGFKPLTPSEAKALCDTFKEKDAVYLPYINPLTGQQWIIHEGTESEYVYYRIRHVYEDDFDDAPKTAATGFARLIKKKKKRATYLQPPKTPPLVYYPSNSSVAWKSIINDREQSVILTEGEFKAAKACQMGFPTISIAGVHSWQNLSKGETVIPSLKMLGLKDRIIYICFDSDYRQKPQVLEALNSLADELAHHGAEIRCINLPDILKDKDEKTGLDDFFVYHGESGIGQFEELVKRAFPLGCAKLLRSYNELYIFCNNPISVIDRKEKKLINNTQFNFKTAKDRGIAQYLGKDGKIIYKRANLNALWLSSEQRPEVATPCYEPGKDELCAIKHNNRDAIGFNTWSGWAFPPKEGDVSLFMKVIDHLFLATNNAAAKHWFMQWLAYPIKNAGAKLASAVLIHGNIEGTGKSSVGEAMKRLYGNNATILKKKDMETSFSSWAADKSFIMVDDIGSYGNREYANDLKELITASTVIIHKKHVDMYEVRNVMNFYFTSNDPNALYLSKSDRRFFIIEAPQTKLSPEFFIEFYDWIKSEDGAGASALLYYLMHYDLKGFNPSTDPPITDAKRHMRDLSASDLGRVITELVENPEHFSVRFNCDFATTGDILNLFKQDDLATDKAKGLLTSNSVAKELSALGIRRYRDGEKVRVNKGTYRFYILRNMEKWITASEDEVRAYLNATYNPVQIQHKRGEKF